MPTALTDTYEIDPLVGPPDAIVVVPGSKSFTNRALVAAALADGVSTLRGMLFSDDTDAMLGCLDALGIEVVVDRVANIATVRGCGGVIPSNGAVLDVRQSGTTARFIVPMVALATGHFVVDGHEQMRRRPMDELIAVFDDAEIAHNSVGGKLPLTIDADGSRLCGLVQVRGDASSQFLSGLLLSAPYARGGLTIALTTELVSAPYVAMTLATMRSFGVEVEHDGAMTRFVVPPTVYRSVDYQIEPDASAASYFFAAAAITGGRVRIQGLGRASIQGDLAFVQDLETMGATVSQGEDWTEVQGPAIGALHGGTFDLTKYSDTAPTLAVVAAFATEPVHVTGVGFIRHKETDRIAAVVAELNRCGIDAIEDVDGFTVVPGRPRPADVKTYDDHRMAMSFALVGLRTPGIRILSPGCVAKTFPHYFDVLETLRPYSTSDFRRMTDD